MKSLKRVPLPVLILALMSVSLTTFPAGAQKQNASREAFNARYHRLETDLDNLLYARLITADQYTTEMNKLNQIKIQERVDTKQGIYNGDVYNTTLSRIRQEIEQYKQAGILASTPTAPSEAATAPTPAAAPAVAP